MVIQLLFLFNIVFGLKMNNNFNNKDSLFNIYNLVNQKESQGYLSTLNYSNKLKDYPFSSLVGFSVDDNGFPILSMSDISQHSKNINKNNNTSLLIPQRGLTSQNQKRVTITGNIYKIIDQDENNYMKEKYLESHKNAYWLKYIDFNMYRLENIKDIQYIGGFGKATKINVGIYLKNYSN